jgi:hypothetical protein
MTAPTNPYAMPVAAPAAAPVAANPYATTAPATAPANPYALPTTTAPAPATMPAPAAPATAPPAQFTATAPAAPVAGGDPFSGPAAQEARGPRVREMYGRLILITPKHVEKISRKQDDGSTKIVDRMTADVVILDGGPCAFGGQPEKPGGKQHDQVAQMPHRNRDMYVSAVGLISQCREALAKRQAGQPGMVLGRLMVGEARDKDSNPPYLLSEPTDADKAIARQYLSTIDVFG